MGIGTAVPNTATKHHLHAHATPGTGHRPLGCMVL